MLARRDRFVRRDARISQAMSFSRRQAVVAARAGHAVPPKLTTRRAIVFGAARPLHRRRRVSARAPAPATRGIVAVRRTHDRARAEDAAPWPRRTSAIRAVPVEVILAEVEQRRGVGLETCAPFQLEARQLEHPDLGQRARACRAASRRCVGERLQHRRPMLPAAATRLPPRSTSSAGQRRRRRLAVGAGDRDDLRRVAALARSGSSACGEQFELALHGDAAARRARRSARGDALVVRRQARADQRRSRRRRAARASSAPRDAASLPARARRSAAACGGSSRESQTRTRGAVARAPARHREAGFAEAEHEHGLAANLRIAAHRSFRLASPTRHSSIVMIQKRTTTCVSFQPDFSK